MSTLQPDTIDLLESLPTLALKSVLSKMSREKQIAALTALKSRAIKAWSGTERDNDAQRKRDKRSESARITISECVDPKRREACLQDPELFLRTYMPRKFTQTISPIHSRLIQTIHDRARTGGKKAVAAPRGRGKSTIVKGMLIYVTAAELVRFIVPICATTVLAGRIYKDYRNEWSNNQLLFEDFPEICSPVRNLEGAPQRASRQHVDGHLTHINWSSQDFLRLPRVPGSANEYMRSQGWEWSPFGGVKMAFAGLDSAFRGMNIDDERPDFLVLDDPETRDSAKSLMQIEDRVDTIEKDIEGLEGQDRPMGMVMITTLQNNYCVSAQFTDPERKPAWEGERYGWIEDWPLRCAYQYPDDEIPDGIDNMWAEYIARRQKAQQAGDRHGMDAVEFYLANREAMDEGHKMLADNFKEVLLEDGTQVIHSALQEAFNKIADTNISAFRAEYQNNPDPEELSEKSQLTPGRVANQLSGLGRGEPPEEKVYSFVGLDIGKYKSHWVKISCTRELVMWVVDYGVAETHGLSKNSTDQAIELAIHESLIQFADSEPFHDAQPVLCLVDSGNWADAIYEACNALGPPFFAAKGWDPGRFRMKKQSKDIEPFLEAYAHQITDHKRRPLWLYNVNTEYWKEWGQERFLVDAFRDHTRLPGSVALFSPQHGDVKQHLHFARHMVSESMELVPVDGKINKRVWVVHDKANNHWLDAYALACAAAGCAGLRLVNPEPAPQPKPAPKPEPRQTILNPHGQPFLVTER